MAKFYYEIDDLAAKSDLSSIESRLLSKKAETSEIIDDKSTKKAKNADLHEKWAKRDEKMQKMARDEYKRRNFASLYGSPKPTYSDEPVEHEIASIIRDIERLKAENSSIVLDMHGKRAVMDPNVAFKKKKGKLGKNISNKHGFYGWTEYK